MSTLLEKAKAVPLSAKGRPHSENFDERLDLALAYLRQEIGPSQVSAAMGFTSARNVINAMGAVLFGAARKGLIEITDKRGRP